MPFDDSPIGHKVGDVCRSCADIQIEAECLAEQEV
jgi:hypothetical protein